MSLSKHNFKLMRRKIILKLKENG